MKSEKDDDDRQFLPILKLNVFHLAKNSCKEDERPICIYQAPNPRAAES